MESSTFSIENNNSLFDKSIESIESTNFYGAQVSLMRCNSPMETCILPIENKNSLFDKSIESIESTNFYGAQLSLPNKMQQSNGKLHFSDRK